MIDFELDETLKAHLDNLKDKTLNELIAQDKEYRRYSKEQGEMERAYLKLHLNNEQKGIVDKLLTLTDTTNMEYNTLNYLAGLLDSITFMTALYTKGDTSVVDSNMLCDYYDGNLIPQALLKESSETIKLREDFEKKSQELDLALDEKKKKLFKEVIDKRQEIFTSLIKDSFISYFRLDFLN